jgi:hypothetical protein
MNKRLARALAVLLLACLAYPATSQAQTQTPKSKTQVAHTGCVGGKWTPAPISQLQAGEPSNPAFHTVWGYACGSNIYMLRSSNVVVPSPGIRGDIIGKTTIPCDTREGSWSPTFVSKLESGSPGAPAFHTVWNYSCGGSIYMVRFSNVITPAPAIRVDIIYTQSIQ